MRALLTARLNGARTAEELRAEIGAAGEAEVVRACQAELETLGELGLAAAVQRVSLLDDTLGYDVYAPTLADSARCLEVKTQSGGGAVVRFFLSRNEYEVGLANPSGWALVACRRAEDGDVRLLGWCRARSLAPYLPVDRNGRWTEALANVPHAVLHAGLPPA